MNNKYIIEVKISPFPELNFSLGFYTERGNGLLWIESKDLVKVTDIRGVRYFALLDYPMTRGHLMCSVVLRDKEPLWNGRENVYNVYTGITLGNCLCKGGEITVCNGYEFSFSQADDIPKDINAKIYYGLIKEWVIGYEHITEEMVKRNLKITPAGPMTDTLFDVVPGDRFTVLVPCNDFLTPKKDNGFGGKIPFDTSLMGANGDYTLTVDEIAYKVYGEFITVDGRLSFNVE